MRTLRSLLVALLLPGLLLLVAGPLVATYAIGGAEAYCLSNCGNQSAPYYTTQVFWGQIGTAILVGGLISVLLTITVYRHLPLGIAGGILIVVGVVIAIVL